MGTQDWFDTLGKPVPYERRARAPVDGNKRYVPFGAKVKCLVTGEDPSKYEQWMYNLPDLDTQIEAATRPVLEQVDEFYGVLDKDFEIDVQVGVEEVKHEVSWVEVEDEIDRIAKEIDAMAGVQS